MAVCLIILMTMLFQGQATTAFEKGNLLYMESDFEGALTQYDRVLALGGDPGILNYNIGNCLFRLDRTGEALYRYLCAKKSMPRDDDLNRNIRISRQKLMISPSSEHGGALRGLGIFTLNEYGSAAAFAGCAAFLFSALYRLRRYPFAKWLALVSVCLALTVVLLMALVLVDLDGEHAIAVKVCDALSEPSRDAGELSFSCRVGEIVEVKGRLEGWLFVEDEKSRRGWVRDGDISVLP